MAIMYLRCGTGVDSFKVNISASGTGSTTISSTSYTGISTSSSFKISSVSAESGYGTPYTLTYNLESGSYDSYEFTSSTTIGTVSFNRYLTVSATSTPTTTKSITVTVGEGIYRLYATPYISGTKGTGEYIYNGSSQTFSGFYTGASTKNYVKLSSISYQVGYKEPAYGAPGASASSWNVTEDPYVNMYSASRSVTITGTAKTSYTLTIQHYKDSTLYTTTSDTVYEGDTVTPSDYATTITGYSLSSTDPASSFTVSGNKTIKLYYTVTPCTLTVRYYDFDTYSSIADTETYTLSYGSTVKEATYKKSISGYRYNCWSKTDSSFKITSDTTITYYYDEIVYVTLTVEHLTMSGSSIHTSDTYDCEYGEEVYPPDYKRTITGYNYSNTSPTDAFNIYTAKTIKIYYSPKTWTVTYDNNGGSGTIDDQTKTYGYTLTLSDGSGFSRTYYTLSSWNTASDGTGTTYALSGSYKTNADLDLYAQWTRKSATITCVYQTMNTVIDTATHTVSQGATITMKGYKKDITDYTFSNSSPYSIDESFVADSDITLRYYYTYTPPQTLTVQHLDMQSGGLLPDETFTLDYGTTVEPTDYKKTITGYTYDSSVPSSAFDIKSATTLKLYYHPNTFTVSYKSNGGTGSIADQTKTYGYDLTLSDGSGFSRSGYALTSWNTKSDGSGTTYALSGTYKTNADLTLYAQWQVKYLFVLYYWSNGSMYSSGSYTDYNTTSHTFTNPDNPPDYTSGGYKYKFKGWGDDTSTVKSSYATSVTMGEGNYTTKTATSTGYEYVKYVYAVYEQIELIPEFAWTSDDSVYIVSGKDIQNLTANAWNNSLIPKINLCEERLGWTPTALPTVSQGERITASKFNTVKDVIITLTGSGSVPTDKTAGEEIKAVYFNGTDSAAGLRSIKNALNGAIAYINSL